MAIQFIDSFGHYSDVLEKWDSQVSSLFPISTEGRFSPGSLLIDGGINGSYVEKTLPTNATTLVSGFGMFFAGSVEVNIMYIADDASPHVTFNFDMATGVVTITRGTELGTVLATSAASAFSADTWHHIETKVFIDNINGFVDCRIDGVSVCSASTVDTQGAVSPDIVAYRVEGQSISGASNFAHMDDLYILDDTGAAPYNDYLGDVKVSVLRPDTDVTTEFTAINGGSNFAEVDEDFTDGDTSFVKSGNISARDEYGVQTFSELGITVGTIYAVQVNNAAKKTDAGTVGYKDELTVGATTYQSAENNAVSGSYKISTFTHQVNPGTSLAWTSSEVESATIGFQLTTKVI